MTTTKEVKLIPHGLPAGAVSNYKKLADYLQKNMERLQSRFSMYAYCAEGFPPVASDIPFETALEAPVCDTVRCVLGMSLLVDLEAVHISEEGDCSSSWHNYYVRTFAGKPAGAADPIRDWIFSSDWEDIDDTIAGAVRRIWLIVISGCCPEITTTSICGKITDDIQYSAYLKTLDKMVPPGARAHYKKGLNTGYASWLQSSLIRYNSKYNENRRYYTVPSFMPENYHPEQLVEFSEEGDAYPHSIAGINHIKNAVPPWSKSPHNF